jgi:Cof subfamily protein (haloacid dehalogenase superfamily)
VAAAIGAVQATGVAVTVATGRTLDFVRAAAGPLGIVSPVVTTQGAVIGNPVSGHLLREWTIAPGAARRLAAWADEHARLCALYFNDDDGHTHIAQNLEPRMPGDFDHLIGTPREVVGPLAPLLESLTRHDGHMHEPVKFMVVSDVAQEPGLVAQLRALFGGDATVTRTHPLLVEVTAPGVDKGAGVLHLCETLAVDPARVLAIGDNDNDIAMFGVVGAAVAVANGSPAARGAAHWVAPSIDEDGAAVALRALLLDDAQARSLLHPGGKRAQ